MFGRVVMVLSDSEISRQSSKISIQYILIYESWCFKCLTTHENRMYAKLRRGSEPNTSHERIGIIGAYTADVSQLCHPFRHHDLTMETTHLVISVLCSQYSCGKRPI
jgi:hypothetical protein